MSNLPIIRASDQGRAGEMPGERFVGKLTGEDTQGLVALAHYQLSPQHGTTEHRHLKSGELFYVLSGTVTMDIDGVEHVLKSGATVWVPAGARHRLSNLGDSDVTMLGMFAPAGPERLFPALMQLHARTNGHPTTDEVAAIRAVHDIEDAGPSRFED